MGATVYSLYIILLYIYIYIYTQQIKDSLGDSPDRSGGGLEKSQNGIRVAFFCVVFFFVSLNFFLFHLSFLLVSHVSTNLDRLLGCECVCSTIHTYVLQSLRNVCWLPVFFNFFVLLFVCSVL